MAYISRIISLKGYNNVLLGRDLAKALKPGTVYGIRDLMGIITLEELGPHAQLEQGMGIAGIITEGVYALTEKEYAAQLKAEET